MNTASLSILRFIAAIIVVFSHRSKGSELLQGAPAFLIAGSQMVTFFFVLSGFVLVLAYYDKEHLSFKQYFIRRSARVVPLYCIALFACLLIDFGKGGADPAAIIVSIFFLQAWIPPYPLSINDPGWFMSALMSFYVLFPLLLFFLKKYIPNPKVVLINALLLWLVTQVVLFVLLNSDFYQGFPSKSHDLIFYFPAAHFCSFFLGVTGCYWLRSLRCEKLSVFLSVFCIMVSLLVLGFLFEEQQAIKMFFNVKVSYGSSFYAPFFLLMIIAFSFSHKRVASRLSVQPFVSLGEMSFAVYIMQVPVWRVVSYFLKNTNISYDAVLLIYITVLMVVGYVLMKYLDNPINQYVRRKYAYFG